MSIHKLNTELARASTEALAVGLHFQHEIYGFAETVLKARAIRASRCSRSTGTTPTVARA